MTQIGEPTQELKEFMQKKTVELFKLMMEFAKETSNRLPDDPQVVYTTIGSIVCASMACFIGYRFSHLEKQDILDGSLLFCDGILRNLEALLEREDFYHMMGNDNEMD